MFAKAFALASLLVAPLAAALSVNPLQNARSQGEVSITWRYDASNLNEPSVMTIELHHESFRNDFAIANTIDCTLEQLLVTLPVVPAQDGYTLRLVNVGNITDIYSESARFAIASVDTSSLPSSSGSSTSGSATGSSTVRSSTTNLPSSISPNAPTSTRTNTATSTPTGTFDNAAASTRYSVAGFLAVVAGVAVVVL